MEEAAMKLMKRSPQRDEPAEKNARRRTRMDKALLEPYWRTYRRQKPYRELM